MAWVRLDEQFPDHPKVVMAGPLAGWLHVCALAYCNRYLTDGFVPAAQVPKLADFDGVAVQMSEGEFSAAYDDVDTYRLAGQLVEVGMWKETRGGFLIHDYLTYQPSRAEVEAKRVVKAAAGRKGGQAKPKHPPSKPEAEAQADPEHNGSRSQADAQAKGEAKPKPDTDTDTDLDTPLPPAERGARAYGQKKTPRQAGTNPRAVGTNPRGPRREPEPLYERFARPADDEPVTVGEVAAERLRELRRAAP